MISKRTVAFGIFIIALFYILIPRIVEKLFLLNEILAFAGLLILIYKRFRIGYSTITNCVFALLAWCFVHAFVSLFRMDGFYYYLRNLVIVYSVFLFFIGFYLQSYAVDFIRSIKGLLTTYTLFFLIFPRAFYERFGMASLFPAIIKKSSEWKTGISLIVLNAIYAITYKSSTAGVITIFYFFLFCSPGYRFFKQLVISGLVFFAVLFIYLHPYISVIHHYTIHDDIIWIAMNAHPILNIDPNNTWRLILWDQVIVDRFPGNLLGIGFGTPMFKYFPIEDYSKVPILPYVLGAHNSFIYLFGRLGIVFMLIILMIYRCIFREYFYFKKYYYMTGGSLFFLGFFAISIIALFNPVLETSIFSGTYWLLLGFVAKIIYCRNENTGKPADL